MYSTYPFNSMIFGLFPFPNSLSFLLKQRVGFFRFLLFNLPPNSLLLSLLILGRKSLLFRFFNNSLLLQFLGLFFSFLQNTIPYQQWESKQSLYLSIPTLHSNNLISTHSQTNKQLKTSCFKCKSGTCIPFQASSAHAPPCASQSILCEQAACYALSLYLEASVED